MRLSRYLAHCGVGSRRTIDAWIEQGRIKQGSHIATLGVQHHPGEEIFLDGHPLNLQSAAEIAEEPRRVLVYHKPIGEMCTRSDPQGRPTVFDNLPVLQNGRWVSVGRLDFQTSGLLLFVNDGTLAHELMHPRYCWKRVYHVKVQGRPEKTMLEHLLQEGAVLDGQRIVIEELDVLEELPRSYWVSLTLRSGVNRAVRRIFESVGQNVVKLQRVQYAELCLPKGLYEGDYFQLSEEELKDFEDMIAKGGT